MGKLHERLTKQLDTEHSQDAKDCMVIYDYLLKIDGSVWSSKWNVLVEGRRKAYPSSELFHKPKHLGYMVIKGIKCKCQGEMK